MKTQKQIAEDKIKNMPLYHRTQQLKKYQNMVSNLFDRYISRIDKIENPQEKRALSLARGSLRVALKKILYFIIP